MKINPVFISVTHLLLHICKTVSLLLFYRSNGWLGLYKGLEAKLTQTVAMAALMFLTYEKIAALVFRLMRQKYKHPKSL